MENSAPTGSRGRTALTMSVRAVWSARTWRATSHLVVGGLVGAAGCVAILATLALAVVLAPTFVGALAALALLLTLVGALSAVQRSRFRAFLDVQIPTPAPELPGTPLPRRMTHALRRPRTWRSLGYHVFAGVFGTTAGAWVVVTWSAGPTLAAAAIRGGPWDGRAPASPAAMATVGLALVLVAPWLARALAAADAAVAARLLGTPHSEELAHRVASLAASRDDVVDATDAERRRIERDLHDGSQQRLTSLAMNLGIARSTLTDLPEPGREVIAQAHDEAKQALSELRDLVRGMHPAVLDDRGLDAALSGLAARSPVPVRLRVGTPERASREVEAVAYFVVSEALANVAKHADATRVAVAVDRDNVGLRVVVTDDGRGGADPDAGSGLRGLSQRVSSVDGALRVDSPEGGPTTIIAELPCGS